jgi:mycothiol synthase
VPTDGTTYRVGEAVSAAFTCADAGGSGLASCTATVATGPVRKGIAVRSVSVIIDGKRAKVAGWSAITRRHRDHPPPRDIGGGSAYREGVETKRLTWRAVTTEDASALARAYAAVEAVDDTGEHYSEQDIREELEDDSLDLGRDTFAALAPDGEVVAFAWVRGSAEVRDLDRVHADGAVVPAARGRGLGRRLLEWAEARAASLHRERHPDIAGVVCVNAHENNASKQALVRAAGYAAIRWSYRMTRSMDDPLPDVPPTPPGLTLAPYATDRDEAVRQAHREAFADNWGATPPDEQRWSRWYTGAHTFRPDVSWLVLHGDEVAAYLLTYSWEADTAATGVREAFLGHLGVRPGWRRRGVGGLLLAAGLQSYRSAGYGLSALTVDTGNATGALSLYERAGYAVEGTSVTWMKPLG